MMVCRYFLAFGGVEAFLHEAMRGSSKDILGFARSLPGKDCLAPRDGESLQKTEDMLFLAALLSASGRMILQCSETTKQGFIYLQDEGDFPTRLSIKQRIAPKTVRARFRDHFYRYRIALSSPEAACMTFSLGEREIRKEKGRGTKIFWDWAAGLRHPFSKEGDPLVSRLHKVSLLHSFDQEPPGPEHLLCPVDGWVLPVLGTAKSPSWSWKMMCGREWKHSLCPDCLGSFLQRLGSMN
jgi:hypothetical protein